MTSLLSATQTPDAALFDPQRSWVVTAGAGTGKTWRLVRRYVRCLQDMDNKGLTAQHILAVTFTRAAATEMRQRVLQAMLGNQPADPTKDPVLAEVRSWPAQQRERLAAQVASAPIETIHSFCARLLAAMPEVSGVAPGVRPMEPDEDKLRRGQFVRRFVDSVLDGSACSQQDDAVALLTEYSLPDVRKILENVIDVNDAPAVGLETSEGVAAARKELWQPQLDGWAKAAREPFLQAYAQVEASTHKDAAGRLQKLAPLRHALAEGNAEAARNAYSALHVSQKKWRAEDGASSEPMDTAWALLNDAMLFRGDSCLIKLDPASEQAHCARMARAVRLGRAARAAYEAELAADGLMRFDDLEYRAEALLAHPEAQGWLAGRYRHLMVDEFQDTSPRQLAIVQQLRAACAAGGEAVTVFQVGDVKQSIYRFRGAEVSLFQGVLAKAPPDQRGHLRITHRTAPELAQVFNQLFVKLLPGVEGESDDRAVVPWSDDDRIETSKPTSQLPGKPLTLLLGLPKDTATLADAEAGDDADGQGDSSGDAANGADDENGENGESEAVDAGEAAKVAAWLANYLAQPEAAGLRRKDIGILLPKWNSAESYRAALQARGIAAQVSGGRGLLREPVVRDLLNLLVFLCDDTDNVAAAGVLRGPAVGLSDLGLLVLARWPGVSYPNGKASATTASSEPAAGPRHTARALHPAARGATFDPAIAVEALIQAGAADPAQKDQLLAQLTADQQALDASRGILADLHRRAGSESTADLLTEAMERLQWTRVWSAERDPERAAANARRFVEVVRAMEPAGPDPAGLLAWVGGDADPTPEGLIAGDADAVTITTCHGAKGLEWRLVILADLHAGLQQGDDALLKLSPIARWLPEGAPAPLVRDVVAPRLNRMPQEGFRADKDPVQSLEAILNSGLNAAEVKRLLYVAMTRAAERLVLSGTFKVKDNLDTKDSKKNADAAPNVPETVKWLPLVACRKTAQYLTTVLQLVPDEARQAWRLNDDSALVELVESVALNQPLAAAPLARSLAAGEAPALPTLPTPLPMGSETQWLAASPSNLQAKHWPGGKLDATDAPARIKLPDDADELGEHGARASHYGTLLHAACELWGMRPQQKPDLAALRRLASALVPGIAPDADLTWLAECLDLLEASPLGCEMAAAAERGELWHEVPFDAPVQAAGTPLALAGRMDVLFRDASGKWVVVDYKLTKKGALDKRAELQSTYAKQLLAYQAALKACGLGRAERAGLWLAASGEAVWLVGAA